MKVGIIGYGAYGKLLADLLTPYADIRMRDVKTISPKTNCSIQEIAECDLIIIAVGVNSIADVCKDLSGYVSPKTIIMDVCSVKVSPSNILKEYLGDKATIVATHPMFGPESVAENGNSVKGLTVFWCDLGYDMPVLISNLFESKLKTLLVKIEPAEHDRRLAMTHGLASFLGRALVEMQLERDDADILFYSKLLEIRDIEAHHSNELFSTMQKGNDYTKEMRKALISHLKNIDESLSD